MELVAIYQDVEFSEFRQAINAGKGTRVKQTEPLSEEDEELLWKKGMLGDATLCA